MTTPMRLGYDEAGSGPVLLLVHGFPLDRTMWSEQLRALSDIRRVVAVDLRGRGKSPAQTDEWTIDLYADDVAKTVEDLGVDQIDLAGLSMGGYVVFSFWRRHQKRVRSLLLIDTKAEGDSSEAKEGREKTAALVSEKGTAELVEGLFPKIFAPTTGDEVKNKVRTMFETIPGSTSAADALAMRDRLDSKADLASISVPTIVIQGGEDALMPVDGARAMAEALPNAKFVVVPDAGHLAPMENAEVTNVAIRDFLESLPETSRPV